MSTSTSTRGFAAAIQRSRRAGVVGVAVGAVVVALGLFLVVASCTDAELLIPGLTVALIGGLMATAGTVGLAVASRFPDVAPLAARNDLLYFAVLVVGIVGATLCSLLGTSPGRFALSFLIVILAHSTFAIAQLNRANIRLAPSTPAA